MEYRQNFTILGHRGCIGVDGIGENTIPAFERALRDGADGIELDMYAIPDIDNEDHLVVFHDDDVDRVTDGSGPIMEMNLDEVRSLRVGDEKTEAKEAYAEKIPLLSEVFDSVLAFDAKHGKESLINIELKGPGTVDPVVRLLGAYGTRRLHLSNMIISSFDHEQLAAFHDAMPDVRTAVLIDDKQFAEHGESFDPAIELAYRLGSFAINPGLSFTTKHDIKTIHHAGLEAYVWTGASQETVDNANLHVAQIFAMAADGVFANNPGGVSRL